jgi:hypothetical protein
LLTYHDVFLFNIRPVRALLAGKTGQTMCLYALRWKGPVAPRTSLRQPTGFQVKGKLRRARKNEVASCAKEVILLDVLLELSLVTAIEAAARLQAMPMLGSLHPMLISLILVLELAMARITRDMLRRRPQMDFHLLASPKALQARQARELMADGVVVFEVVPQSPLIVEGAQAQIAEDIVAGGVVDVVLKPVSVFEDASAEVAVVLMVWRLLDVVLERRLVGEAEVADTTPVLELVEVLVAVEW